MSPFKHLRLLMLPLFVIGGYLAGGYWNFVTPILLFVLLPVWQWVQTKTWRVEQLPQQEQADSWLTTVIPLIFVPVVTGLVVWATLISGHVLMHFNEWVGLALSVGIVNGSIGFILAHEFIHHHSITKSWPGYVLLALSNYYHYSIEHIHGHHVYVCTNRDPNTARKGESFYQFLPRAVAGTWLSAVEIERNRLKKQRLPFTGFQNRIILFAFLQIITWIVIFSFWKAQALSFFILQSCFAITLLYLVNYIQHYGLLRQEYNGNKLERIAPHHAWLAGGPADAFSIFQMENHADHHLHPTHAYHILKAHAESPVLPAPYATMIVIALIPPVWFSVVDKRIPAPSQPNPHETILSTSF